MDARIDQKPIDIQFCLHLPQSSYDPRTGDLVQASSDLPVLRSTIPSPKRTLVFDPEASSGDEDGESSNDDED